MKFGLQKTDMQISCHTFQCFNRAAYYLGRPDSPRGTEYYVCDPCADELKDQVLADYVAKKEEPPEGEFVPFEDIVAKEYEEMTVAELKSLLHLSPTTKKTKAELIELAKAAE